MSNWISFKELRQSLDFARVLEHYKVEVSRKGNQLVGFCPLPGHDGERRSPSFSANLERGIFQCFGCRAKGNVLDFAGLMEEVDLKDGHAMRKVALKLQEVFGIGGGTAESKETKAQQHTPTEDPELFPEKKESPKVSLINAPLDFELKDLDHNHPYLAGRHILPETAQYFQVGVAPRGSLQGRLAISLHDEAGTLVGYAGRVLDDTKISGDSPKYRFPGPREKKGVSHQFRKGQLLYNFHRIKAPVNDLIVVEGFFSVWWLHQCRIRFVVATMGSGCSDYQAELIVSIVNPKGRIWLMPDCDAAGERGAIEGLKQLSPYRFVRWISLEDKKQPTDLSPDAFKEWFDI